MYTITNATERSHDDWLLNFEWIRQWNRCKLIFILKWYLQQIFITFFIYNASIILYTYFYTLYLLRLNYMH